MNDFKDGKLHVLVATDIAARGIDVSELELVIQYDLPNVPETYVHRIGRTGRAKASGIAISFCATDERPYLKDIEKLIKQKVHVVAEHPFLSDEASEAGQVKGGDAPEQPKRNNRNRSRNRNRNRNKPKGQNNNGPKKQTARKPNKRFGSKPKTE